MEREEREAFLARGNNQQMAQLLLSTSFSLSLSLCFCTQTHRRTIRGGQMKKQSHRRGRGRRRRRRYRHFQFSQGVQKCNHLREGKEKRRKRGKKGFAPRSNEMHLFLPACVCVSGAEGGLARVCGLISRVGSSPPPPPPPPRRRRRRVHCSRPSSLLRPLQAVH